MAFKEKRREFWTYCKDNCLDREIYCFDEMAECSFQWYEAVAQILHEMGFETVYDVGASIGLQRHFFNQKGIDFIPIEPCNLHNVNGNLNEVIKKAYPFHIHTKTKDILISNLCIGYLINGNDVLDYLKEFNYLLFNVDANLPKDVFTLMLHIKIHGFNFYFYEKKHNKKRA